MALMTIEKERWANIMSDFGKVSVIIPTYNREDTILKAINSVINQSYNNIEIIVIDDCSTDGTLQYISAIHDTRLHVYRNETNRGACYSRNRGVSLAKGEYIAFQDSDDEWQPFKLEKCLHEINTHNVDMVFSGFTTQRGYKPNYNLNDSENKFYELLRHNCVSTQTILAKRNVFDDIKFDEFLPRYQDWDIAIRIAQKYKIYFIDISLVNVYLQADSISKNPDKGLAALQIIYDKNSKSIEEIPSIRANYYEFWGVNCEKAGKDGTKYFKKAFFSEPTIKRLIRYLLARLKIYKYVDKLSDI